MKRPSRSALAGLTALYGWTWSAWSWAQGEPNAAELDAGYPVVITPTRLRQSLADVPASVTVISAETMRRYGVRSVVDALRLVPGMAVTEVSGNDARINYHGTNVLVPRRMNVLIDGVSVYRPGIAQVDWSTLPVAMVDIERIEVTRGPDSAAYGPNSLLAIVNIITKHPKDIEDAWGSIGLGSSDRVELTARTALKFGDTRLRLTAERQRDSGYDFVLRSNVAGGHDSTDVERLSVRSETSLDARTSLQLQAWLVDAVKQVPFVDSAQRTFPDAHVHDYYLDALWKKVISPLHELQIRGSYSDLSTRQTWTSCIPTAAALPQLYALWRANPAYVNQILAGRVPSGGSAQDNALAAAALTALAALGSQARSPLCVQPNQNLQQSRSDIEVQDTVVLAEGLRVVSGLGARVQQADSATFLGGDDSNVLYRAFANVEYKPVHWLSINAGGYAEDDRLAGTSFSPRLAFNVRVADNQVVRFIYSTGTRAPDLYEQRADWSYAFEAPRPVNGQTALRFYQSATSPGGLKPERIESHEVGYLLNVPRLGLLFDVKLFDDHLTHLLSEKLQVSDFHPTNDNAVRLSGTEFQASAELSTAWSGFFNYAYLCNSDATNALEQTQYSRHSGALGVSYAPGDGWRLSLDYQASSADGLGQSRYGRSDLTVAKTFQVGGKDVRMMFTAARLDQPETTTFRDFSGANPVLTSRFDSRMRYFGQVSIGF